MKSYLLLNGSIIKSFNVGFGSFYPETIYPKLTEPLKKTTICSTWVETVDVEVSVVRSGLFLKVILIYLRMVVGTTVSFTIGELVIVNPGWTAP